MVVTKHKLWVPIIINLLHCTTDIRRTTHITPPARIEHFALNDVLTALEAEFGVLANQQGMRFDVQHCQGWVRSDKKLLRRVLQNFLTNAFRYNPRGRVLLGVRREENRYRIEVWDDGDGIPHDRQQDIFQEFTRLDRQGAEQGLGLGLAIARGISQILQQPLGLRSWPGKGTVFSISVDQGTPEAVVSAEPRSPSAVSESALKGCRVLCVDNETDILTGMAQLLSRWGCDVRCAPDVSGAMQQIDDDWHPEFVLSDYHLANQQTGLQVLQQCQLRLGRCFRGAIISADRSADIQQSVTGLGFAYISKPVKPLKLRALLQQRGQ